MMGGGGGGGGGGGYYPGIATYNFTAESHGHIIYILSKFNLQLSLKPCHYRTPPAAQCEQHLLEALTIAKRPKRVQYMRDDRSGAMSAGHMNVGTGGVSSGGDIRPMTHEGSVDLEPVAPGGQKSRSTRSFRSLSPRQISFTLKQPGSDPFGTGKVSPTISNTEVAWQVVAAIKAQMQAPST